MKAVMQVAGSGSRFKPYSFTNAKIMTKFLGKPLLFYHIDEIVAQGIKEIILICNKENISQIRKEVKKAFKKLKFYFVLQDVQLGPSHAIYCAKDLLKEEFFLFKYADSVHAKDLLIELFKKFDEKSDGIITLRKVKDPKRYGIARLEGEKVVEIIEKPDNAPSDLGLVGLGILKTDKFIQGIEKDTLFKGKKEVAPPEYVLRDNGKLDYWVYAGERTDLGKPWDILLTTKLLIKRFGSGKNSRKIARSAKIGKNCFIGKKAIIEKNVTIKNYASVEGTVKEGSVIDGSVIMEGSVIGKNSRIVSSVIGTKNTIGDKVIVKAGKTKVFIKDHYEDAPIKVGVFTGDQVSILDNVKCEAGRVVYPNKNVKDMLNKDYLIRVVIFDADNTLYNTRSVAKQADLAAMRFFKKDNKKAEELYGVWKEEIVKNLMVESEPHKRHRRFSYQLLAEKYKLNDVDGAFTTFLASLLKHITLFPQVELVLKSLKQFSLGIVSEDPSDVLIPKIKKMGIAKYFQLILTSDSVGKMKPCKEYIDIAFDALGVSAHECIFIGDSYEKDLSIPKSLGATIILLGEKGKADYTIQNFGELKKIMEDF
tara:strand:+ start:3165 stop:4943 length:1779 start_codon:yes stop_codon:yes gene_type:complete